MEYETKKKKGGRKKLEKNVIKGSMFQKNTKIGEFVYNYTYYNIICKL